jgi:hypothetical protein
VSAGETPAARAMSSTLKISAAAEEGIRMIG